MTIMAEQNLFSHYYFVTFAQYDILAEYFYFKLI